MGFVLREPGTMVETPLPGVDGVIVVYKVPTENTARQINRVINSWWKNNDRYVEAVKTAIGAIVVALKGVEYNGSDEIQIETDGAGVLTEKCFETIMPLSSSLLNFTFEVTGVNKTDQKNF